MLRIILLLAFLTISYVAMIMLRKNYYLQKSQSFFQNFIPTNKVKLKAIYDDHATVFIQASYQQPLSESEVADLNGKLHASQALHPNENIWHGDWDDFCTRNLTAETLHKLYGWKTKKPSDTKKIVFFIGTIDTALKRFYEHLSHK